MFIVYKYRYYKVLGFIATEGGGITEPGVLYLSSYPGNYYNVSIFPIICHHAFGRHLSTYNSIYNHNRVLQSDLALDRYWVIQSGYSRLATEVSLGMVIIYGKLLLCHDI